MERNFLYFVKFDLIFDNTSIFMYDMNLKTVRFDGEVNESDADEHISYIIIF